MQRLCLYMIRLDNTLASMKTAPGFRYRKYQFSAWDFKLSQLLMEKVDYLFFFLFFFLRFSFYRSYCPLKNLTFKVVNNYLEKYLEKGLEIRLVDRR